MQLIFTPVLFHPNPLQDTRSFFSRKYDEKTIAASYKPRCAKYATDDNSSVDMVTSYSRMMAATDDFCSCQARKCPFKPFDYKPVMGA